MILFQHLSAIHKLEGFSCGNKPLDDYLKKVAIHDQRKNTARTFVAIDSEGDLETPVGYFTLGATEKVVPPLNPGGVRELAHPAELMYLARDLTWRKTGMGSILLLAALEQAVKAIEHVGLPGIYLTTTSQGARLYEDFGFSRVPGGDFYMPMYQAKNLLERGGF